jgi:hypothetical protein
MQDEQLKKIIKYVMVMRKYKSYDKCSKQIAQALYRCKRTKQCIKDANSLLEVLISDKK